MLRPETEDMVNAGIAPVHAARISRTQRQRHFFCAAAFLVLPNAPNLCSFAQ
jgi:hypothetical protein